MSYRYVIDAYAWIEYFRASEMGLTARQYIESGRAATPTIVVAELTRKLLQEIEGGRETRDGMDRRLEFLRATTEIADLDFDLAKKSAAIDMAMKKKVKGWGLADSIILGTARAENAKVVTGDEHFKELSDAIFLKP